MLLTGPFNTLPGAEIAKVGDAMVLKSAILQYTLALHGDRLDTRSLIVDGGELLAEYPPNRNFSLEFSRADPDRRPTGIRRGEAEGSLARARDASLFVSSGRFDDRVPDVRWEDPVVVSGTDLNFYSGRLSHAITRPSSELVRLAITIPLARPEMLEGVEITLLYELFERFPVIRKSIRVSNGGRHWLKLSRLAIEDLELHVAFNHPVPLTPWAQNVESSLIGFAGSDGRRGVIAASEVPAGLRRITGGGAMGYNTELFEWVLGPGEAFTSEPVFYFAFAGDVHRTIAADSTPLDRAVEGPLQKFMDRHIVLPAASLPLHAPQWLTWASFGSNVNDKLIRRQADIAALAGFKQLLIDDGWQKDRVGTEVDTKKFPDFAATVRHVRSLGLSLGVWLSCYRDAESADLRDMPDGRVEPPLYYQWWDDSRDQSRRRFAMSFSSPWRNYYARDIVGLHEKFGVDYFKQDFTMLIYGDIAEGHESRTKKESLLRMLRGLLAAQDEIRRQAPQVTTELTHEIYWGNPGPACDIAVLKHAVQYHTSINNCMGELPAVGSDKPVTITPEEHRRLLLEGCHLTRQRFYALRGLPLHRIEFYAIATQNHGGSLTPGIQDRQVASMLMGAPLTFSGDLERLTDEQVAHYRKRFDLLARLQQDYDIYRHFQFSGVPAPTDQGWHWWGKLNESGEGAVVVMRGSDGPATRAINIPWVERTRRYRVTACLAGRELGELTGEELLADGVLLSLSPLGQEILELSAVASGP